LKVGDRIIRVNDIDISTLAHGDVVKIIKDSGLTVQLTVSNSVLNPDPSQFIEMPFSPTNSANGGMNAFSMIS
jgi:C-terminal processing protease CtpA/Prc